MNVSDGVEIGDDVIRERVVMGEVGAVFVTVPITARGGLGGAVTVAARGIVSETPMVTLDEEARVAIEGAVRDLNATGGASAHEAIRDVVRRAARKVYARSQAKPMVVVTLREG